MNVLQLAICSWLASEIVMSVLVQTFEATRCSSLTSFVPSSMPVRPCSQAVWLLPALTGGENDEELVPLLRCCLLRHRWQKSLAFAADRLRSIILWSSSVSSLLLVAFGIFLCGGINRFDVTPWTKLINSLRIGGTRAFHWGVKVGTF